MLVRMIGCLHPVTCRYVPPWLYLQGSLGRFLQAAIAAGPAPSRAGPGTRSPVYKTTAAEAVSFAVADISEVGRHVHVLSLLTIQQARRTQRPSPTSALKTDGHFTNPRSPCGRRAGTHLAQRGVEEQEVRALRGTHLAQRG
eukprot:584895-Pyramimonas_sp.AAC.1